MDPKSDPKTWEKYFKDIVRRHYLPANCRDVPDGHGGDFGVEIFTLDGHAFQCYLPEQSSDVGKLVEAQKEKIRGDISKFTSTYKNNLEKLFGNLKICRWILATPYNKSAKLAQYCAQKSIEVRGLSLPYVADDFEILVHTEDEYPQEVASLRQSVYQVNLDFQRVTEVEAEDWVGKNLEFLKNLDFKLPKIATTETQAQKKVFLVKKYLEYQNLLDHLRNEWEDIYKIIVELVGNRQEYLASRSMTAATALPEEILKEELNDLVSDITREIKTIGYKDIELIKWGVVADWLIRCPLDFKK